MLDENCPVSHLCPLMQDPVTKNKWSAAIDAFLVPASNEEELAHEKSIAETQRPVKEPEKRKKLTPAEKKARKAEKEAKTKQRSEQKKFVHEKLQEKALQLKWTEAVLLDKLGECTAFLSENAITDAHTDDHLTKINTIVEIAGNLIETLKDL